MDHASGAHTTVEISYSYFHTTKKKRHEFVYELIGTEGVIRYDGAAKTFTLDNASGSHSFPFHPEKNFTGMYQEFARALAEGGSALLPSAQEGLRVTDIAREATNQAISHRALPEQEMPD